MEIRIKTADEFRNAHVVIEVRAEEGEDVRARPLVADGYPSELDWAAVRAERDAARERAQRLENRNAELYDQNQELTAELDRYRKAHICTSRCSMNSHVAFEGNRIVKDLEAELARRTEERDEREAARAALEVKWAEATRESGLARRQLIDLGEALIVERERADRATEWAERAEGRLAAFSLEQKAKLADAERAIEILSSQLGRISGAVHSSELVHSALRRDWTSWSEREAAALTTAVRQVRDALGSPSLPEPAI